MREKVEILLLLVVALTTTALFVVGEEARETVVETEYGKVEGFSHPTHSHNPRKASANVFLGIPFAKPPVGQLRYEKPVEPDRWRGVRETKKFAAACAPISRVLMRGHDRDQFSEDCLYLNVIAPAWKSEDKRGFAVLVYVHGGGFQLGQAHHTGYSNFVENYLPRDVLVVTIQYRLAQFGFAALNNDDFAGNYGLWDQRAALQFVQRNIARFGGNPERVTLWGHSAGAASVSHLTASPHLKGLISRAIQMSGSPYGEWACSQRVIAPTRAFARALNCLDDASSGVEGGNLVKECLKSKSTDELLDAVEQIGTRRKNDFNFILFGPRIDGDFHAQNLTDEIASAPRMPTLMGVTDLEAILFTLAGVIKEVTDLYIAPEDYSSFSEETFREFTTKFIANKQRLPSMSARQLEQIREKIFDFYIRDADKHDHNRADDDDNDDDDDDDNNNDNSRSYGGSSYDSTAMPRDATFYMQQQIKLTSDVMFLVPVLMEARMKADLDWPIFFYRFSYVNPDVWFGGQLPIIASTHSSEYPYIFALPPTAQAKFNATDRAVKEAFLEAIAKFAKNGDPTPASLRGDERAGTAARWPRLGAAANAPTAALEHVRIGATTRVRRSSRFMTATVEFWRELRAQLDFVDIHAFPEMLSKYAKNEL